MIFWPEYEVGQNNVNARVGMGMNYGDSVRVASLGCCALRSVTRVEI